MTSDEDRGAGLWSAAAPERWSEALAQYERTIERQGSARLPEVDRWYREELPAAISARVRPGLTHEEVVRTTEWKMARGVWRGRNLALVRGNTPESVAETSERAFALVPDPKKPIAELARLAGVGPATASALAAAAAPEVYPFFDELVAAQVPGLGPVAFTPSYYARYADALRDRARRLGPGWTPVLVERALWAAVGGKAGVD